MRGKYKKDFTYKKKELLRLSMRQKIMKEDFIPDFKQVNG